jgi:hypothetical protein
MKFLSFTTLLDNDVALSEVQQISGSRLLGNATGSTANVSQISLGAGLEFSGSTLRVNSSIPVASGTCQFLGVITPATDMYVYKDNVPNSRLNTPTGILRVLYFKYKLLKDSDDTLLRDNYKNVQIEEINRNGTVHKSTMVGSDVLQNAGETWNEASAGTFLPKFNFNTTTGDLDLFIDYTNGGNDYAYDVRLVVDVEYFDYTL